VSLTDRCNFRCLYCLPETEAAQNFYRGHWAHLPNPTPNVEQWVPRSDLVSFEEIERVVRLAVPLGIRKIRLTGGEPLLRHELEKLIGQLAAIAGIEDLAMTTNGFLFTAKARALRAAGLHRVSFSLDSLDRNNFKKITGRDAEDALGRAHMTVNKNAIPNDPEKPTVTSGIRIGSPAITTRGFGVAESEQLANLIADVLEAPQSEAVQKRVLAQTQELCRKFPVYGGGQAARTGSAQSVAAAS